MCVAVEGWEETAKYLRHLLDREDTDAARILQNRFVREGIQLAVYSLIFEGVKNKLWEFKDRAAGDAFMLELEKHQKAVPPEIVAATSLPRETVVAKY